MCGIVGIVYRDRGRAVPPDLLRSMCDAIAHRGPDDEGRHVDGRVGLGMRRLSIIDLAGGHQPIFNEDRSKVIVFNGEIYNYRDLRAGIVARGHTVRTDSDTETIVHLYEERGARCVEPLRGMFAFAVWDETEQTLFLARDRFGIKPLYVVQGGWGIAFASELKALHAVGLAGGDLDWEALDSYFRLGYIPAPATPFVGVRKLEPGYTLTWRDGETSVRRYWDLPTAEERTPRDVERRVLEALDGSVEAHLVSDVPVAAFLSGGLDSSAVVASWAQSGEAPHAYTARYHGSGAQAADETSLARALADRYGARLTVVDVEPDLRDDFEAIVAALDEPHADESAIPTWLISRRVAEDYKVALAGTGGDELFAGYRRHLGLLLSAWYGRLPGAARRAASGLANLLPEPRGPSLGTNRLKRFLAAGTGTAPDRYLDLLKRIPGDGHLDLYAPALRGAISGTAASRHFNALFDDGGAPPGLKAALYLDYKTYLPDDLLHLSDRLSMAHSLEVRVPFVDHVLVEALFPLPDRIRVGLGRPKRLLRRALRPRLPAEHFRAPKRGFVGPTAMWLRNELRDVLTDELSPSRMDRLGFFDPGVVARLLDDHFTRRHNREGILWELLCFSAWHRRYVETATPAHETRVATAARSGR